MFSNIESLKSKNRDVKIPDARVPQGNMNSELMSNIQGLRDSRAKNIHELTLYAFVGFKLILLFYFICIFISV